MAGTVKTDAELVAQIDAGIKVNGNREITPPIHNSIEQNIVASKLSIKDGGNVVEVLTGYTTELTPTDNKHFATKKYVDDSVIPAVDININGVVQDTSTNREWRTAQADTGALTYGGISVASTTEVNIGACTGYVIDNETTPGIPTYTYINYAGELAKTVTTLGSGIATYVLLDSTGTIVFQNTFPTPSERREMIYLSKIGHPTGTINTAGDEVDCITSPLSQFRDMFQAFNYINNGVLPSANTLLTFKTSAGNICGNGINFVADNTSPNNYSVSAQVPVSFLYRTQTGAGGGFTTAFDPTMYDLAGTATAIGGGVNNSTIQYVFYVPPLGFIVQRGQIIYSTFAAAIAALGKESTFVLYPSLEKNAILIGAIVSKKSCTDLNNTSDAAIFAADKLGQLIGASAGVSTGTFQTIYMNSAANPSLTTTVTGGAVEFRNGGALDTDNVFEVQNIAGTSTFSVNGNGALSNTLNPSLNTTYNLGDSGARWLTIYGATINGTYLEVNNTGPLPAAFISTHTEVYPNVASTAAFATTNYAGWGLSVNNASGAAAETAQIRAGLLSPGTAGSENGELQLRVEVAGTLTTKVLVNPTGFSVNGSVSLLDSTYKVVLDVSSASTLRIGNGGFTGLVIPNGMNIVLGTGTGSRFGNSTSAKLSFWGAATIVQPTTAVTAATFVANTSGIANDTATYGGYTMGQVVAALKAIGLLA